jgi:hypothetical protein
MWEEHTDDFAIATGELWRNHTQKKDRKYWPQNRKVRFGKKSVAVDNVGNVPLRNVPGKGIGILEHSSHVGNV